jgi:GWxTD domain-containing protein
MFGSKMLKVWWSLLLLCLPTALVWSQVRRDVEMLSAVDVVQFRVDSVQTAVEFAIALPKAKLPYDEIATELYRTQLELSVAAYQGERLVQKNAVKASAVDSASAREKGQLVLLVRLILPPEKYRAVLTLKSLGRKDFQLETERPLTVRAFDATQPAMSDILIGAQAYRSTIKKSMFYKNGYEVVPNPSALFGTGFDTALFYAEFYNLNGLSKENKFFQRSFLMRSGQMLEGTERRLAREPTHETVAFVERIPIENLASGGYEFHLQLVDTAAKPVLAQTKKFFVFNPSVKINAARATSSDESFTWLTEENAKEMRVQITALITPDEIKAYDTLKTLRERQQFFQRFWAARGGASARREFMNRVSEADKLYASRSRRGYETDRGRVFLKYGKPTQVESVAGSQQSRPYEIWTYLNSSNQTEAIFVFIDRGSFGSYELVHSTAQGEPQNPNWRAFLAQPAR